MQRQPLRRMPEQLSPPALRGVEIPRDLHLSRGQEPLKPGVEVSSAPARPRCNSTTVVDANVIDPCFLDTSS